MKSNSFAITTGIRIIFPLVLLHVTAGADTSPKATAPSAAEAQQPADDERTISFPWRPKAGPSAAYTQAAIEDQHQIVIYKGAEKQPAPSIIVGFHGQPSRGTDPRNYAFNGRVKSVVSKMISDKEIAPVVLVLPVFRFVGQNWPGFDLVDFKEKVIAVLKEQNITTGDWFLFGHSGAAGCGGEGLNQANRIAPKAVGFFDTCLGTGWQNAVKALQTAQIQTLNMHSVETAGFRPKQRPEYQAGFDFGRAYGPLGIRPVNCPVILPEAPLRDQPYRCAAASNGKMEAYVVNTGEGVEAHNALLPEALRYFLRRFIHP